MLGGVLGGLAGALLLLTLIGAARRGASLGDAPRTALEHAIDRTAKRYAQAASRRGEYYFARGKLAGDPATAAIAGLGALGSVLDLGCGRGQLAVLLLEAGTAERVHGIDWDEQKVALARRAAAGLLATFAAADVREEVREDHAGRDAGGSFDTALLVDVLHYFSRDTQDALLLGAARRVGAGGRLVLREADLGRGPRAWITRLFEGVGTALAVNRGERVLFRDVRRELVPLLEAEGFACTVAPCWGGTPFSNVLLVATRK